MSGKVKKSPIFIKSSRKKGQSQGHVADKRFKSQPSTSDSPSPNGSIRKPSQYSPMGDLHNYMGHMKKAAFHDAGHNTVYPGFIRTGTKKAAY